MPQRPATFDLGRGVYTGANILVAHDFEPWRSSPIIPASQNSIELRPSACPALTELRPPSVSANSDEDVKAAALDMGDVGYVLKNDMVGELVPAIRAALRTKP